MKQKIAASLKKSMPALYRVANDCYNLKLKPLLDAPRHRYCRIAKQVYFGPAMLAGQTGQLRQPHMRKAVSLLFSPEAKKEEFRILEIGSWAGQSATLWGSALSQLGQTGKVFCVDPWQPFAKGEQASVNSATNVMDRIARRDEIFPLFWHNIKSAGLANTVIPLRGKSVDVLPCIKPESFDLVFVDGSHSYTDFITDLRLAGPLVKQSGFICGDDLELQSHDVDMATAQMFKEKDYITDPKTGREYHPGVCLGVSHFFKRPVSSYDGFWIVKKSGDTWSDVQLY